MNYINLGLLKFHIFGSGNNSYFLQNLPFTLYKIKGKNCFFPHVEYKSLKRIRLGPPKFFFLSFKDTAEDVRAKNSQSKKITHSPDIFGEPFQSPLSRKNQRVSEKLCKNYPQIQSGKLSENAPQTLRQKPYFINFPNFNIWAKSSAKKQFKLT